MRKKILTVVVGVCMSASLLAQKATLLPPANGNFSSLEKNVLFYADRRFTVIQTGRAQLQLSALFDGQYIPSYSTVAPSVSDPTIITIDIPSWWHTQRGAYVGWTTRYWPPKKFKIEAYETATAHDWITVANENNFSAADFIVELSGLFSKLRFTFYEGSGDNGLFGISELFYLHSEEVQAYDALMVKYNHDGNVGIGTDNPQSLLDVRSDNNDAGLRVSTSDNAVVGAFTWRQDAIAISAAGYQNPDMAFNTGGNERMRISKYGNIGIGTTNPSQKLAVNGTILAKKVKVSQAATDWPDYVFDSSYQLPSLDSVSSFIQVNKHLPDMPSAAIVEKGGHDLGEVQKLLLKKLEELTLYAIEQNKTISELKSEIKELKNKK